MSTHNIYGYRDRQLLSRHYDRYSERYRERFPNFPPPLPSLSKIREVLDNPCPSPTLPVCIIGAGMAGLYTAMILQDLKIDYHIVDANTKERVGGRVFTYRFPGGDTYDYYDVGAMRFPDIPFMNRVFDLFRNRNLPVKLIPYIMDMVDPPNTFLFFNNARVNNQDSAVAGDPFNVLDYIEEVDLATPQNVDQKIRDVLQPFRNLFRPRVCGKVPDIATAIGQLYDRTDKYSMRAYMSQALDMDDKDIHWCETLDKTTGWYDRSLAENVLESLAFDWPTARLTDSDPDKSDPEPQDSGSSVSWYCLDGGSSTLPQAMFNSLPCDVQKAALFQSPVTAISRDAGSNTMTISINNVPSSQSYSAIISTIPLPRLSLVDLTGANINGDYAQWSAIRELQYTPATKIGILFTTPWWETELVPPIHGGKSLTDLPIRMIVYPSYPDGVAPENMSKVLIVSFAWTQDADRLGALMNGHGTMKQELIDVVFRDLAAVHGVTVQWLLDRYTGTHFAWDWQRDSLTMGAFALFGPSVYENGDIYKKMLRPAAGGKLFFAGEATSSCHGWVAGALDSAWRAVDYYLALNHPKEVRDTFHDRWGSTEYWDDEEVDQTHDLTKKFLGIVAHQGGISSE